MQDNRTPFDTALAPAVRALLVLPVALFLGAVVAASTAASHVAVLHMTAQIQGPQDLAMAAAPQCTAGTRPQAG